MRDVHFSISKFITLTLWAWMAFLLIAAWATWAEGLVRVPFLLGLTGCASSAVAATAQIRCYTLEVCRVMRSVAWHPEEDDGRESVRSLR